MTTDKIENNLNTGKENKMEAPISTSEITAEWLETVISQDFSNSKINSIEIDKNFGPVSLLGKAVRVIINYTDEKTGPKSVIVKFAYLDIGFLLEGNCISVDSILPSIINFTFGLL